MYNKSNPKILGLGELVEKAKSLRAQGKVVVQSHGVFDLIHPGIVRHLQEAKDQGDILIVTVIRDRDVRRGPGRPVFTGEMRVQNVAAIECVDYVAEVEDEVPFQCIKRIKPDVFAKGQAYKERDRHIHDRIFNEEREMYFEAARLHETGGISFNSSGILNNFVDIYSDETSEYIRNFADKYSFSDVADKLGQLQDMKVLLIGDGIIDEYHYCDSLGKTSKSNIVASRYLKHEVFAGGAFAIANHLSGICGNITLATLLGTEDSREDYIRENLRPNVEAKFFYREDGPTVIKKRYVHEYLNQKLFEVAYLSNNHISPKCEQEILDGIAGMIEGYDLVCISDFGHGLVTDKLMGLVESKSSCLAVNTQTNSANTGFNLITKYNRPGFVCLDEQEARLAVQDRYSDIEDVVKSLVECIGAEALIVTLGRKGAISITGSGEINRVPIFSSKIVDTVGAGDAFFAFTAPCFAKGMHMDFVTFIGNAVGALAVQIMCNKKPVEKHELLAFVHGLLQQKQKGNGA